jgi:hypothetical protein
VCIAYVLVVLTTIWHDISACTHINTSTAHKQISITTWLILILCALVSFACLSIDNAIYQNNEPVVPVTDGGTTFYPEPQNHPDIFSVNSVTEFNIAGWLLFLTICGFYMLARRSELRLLRKVTSCVCRLQSIADCARFSFRSVLLVPTAL